MTAVDDGDPFKGLKTKKLKKPLAGLRHWLFALIAVMTVISGVRHDYDEMRFGVLILFFMLVVDYLHDIRKAQREFRRELDGLIARNTSSLTQTFTNIPTKTIDIAKGETDDKA